MDNEEIKQTLKQTEQQILRGMIWVNTSLLIFLLFLNVNIAAWLFIDKLIYRAASFLVISLITLFFWERWRRMVGDVLN